jgi:hypothetical protein
MYATVIHISILHTKIHFAFKAREENARARALFASLSLSDYEKLKTWIERHDDVNFLLAQHGVVVFFNDTIIERRKATEKKATS